MEWGYAGSTGPEHWASLSPEYSPCGEGAQQSPVDLTGYEHGPTPRLSLSYDGGVSGVALVRGSVIVEFAPGSSLTLGEQRFELLSAHAHAPAEHRVDGEAFAAELHVVHEDPSGDALVVAVLYRSGPPSPVLQAMLDGVVGAAPSPQLGAADFVPRSSAFYNYTGSKTTPPCQEPVAWVVMRDADTVSPEQVRALESYSGGPNNRPVQPLRGRKIVLVGG
ncbi:MAG: carbonic anhydrase family protein [Chloroflexi bacterium]|nr:carbonic anhydrase family protein [Chloroflexota bacterium]